MIAGPAVLAGLLPGDKIEFAAGEKASAASLLDMIRGSHPGTRLPLHVIRDGRSLDLDLVVGDREQWAAPSAYRPRIPFTAAPRRATAVWLDAVEAKVDASAA